MHLLDARTLSAISTLQALDDAIAFRLARLDMPCADCIGDRKCDDHAADRKLIESYRDKYTTAFADAAGDVNPADLDEIMQPGDVPPTVAIFGAAIMTQLRTAAADGPLVTNLGEGPVLIETAGNAIVEHPLAYHRRLV